MLLFGCYGTSGADSQDKTNTNATAQAVKVSSTSDNFFNHPIEAIFNYQDGLLATVLTVSTSEISTYKTKNFNVWSPFKLPVSSTINSMISNDSDVFVAVGNLGEIVRSVDGINWQKSNSGVTDNLLGITSYSEKFVAVGDKGAIITSTDGLNWKHTYVSGYLTAVTVNQNGVFVAVSPNGMIYTSRDGSNWSRTFLGNASPNKIAVNENGIFIITDFNSGIDFISEDGYNWKSSFELKGTKLNGIATDGNKFVVVGDKGVVYVSKDGGSSWIRGNSGVNDNLYGIIYSSYYGSFIAFDKNITKNDLLFSIDGGYNWVKKDFWLSVNTKISEFSINGFHGIINGHEIIVKPDVPLTLKYLRPSFSIFPMDGGYLTVNGAVQHSGETIIDFTSSPVVYTLHKLDGTTQEYKVTVQLPEEKKEENPEF